ncbi:MAG: AAA-like domain-containing protein [Anaerolineaceae bacterium]|nr:AAA-like domain-containing protein [Anaerolineaceae bacterium]
MDVLMKDPFYVGGAVSSNGLIDRKSELRRLANWIKNDGQSAAIIGEARSGKTSLLNYLSAAETGDALYGEEWSRLRFQYLDAQILGSRFDAAHFWEFTLAPIAELVKKEIDIQPAYQTCRLERFGNFVLERLFSQLQASGWRLVLLLDEFDTILLHPVLNQAEFYGGLRSLASRFTSLSLVISARQSLADLNRHTQEFSHMGSPYFNFLQEINLGAFKEKDALELLGCGNEHFTRKDRDFLLSIAGGHPFLLQAAASALWAAYEDGEKNAALRYTGTGKYLFHQAAATLRDAWRLWPPETKKAFTIIALDNVPRLLGERQFDLVVLTNSLPDYAPEIRYLETRGYISPSPALPSQWGIRAQVMLWWLAEELIQALRRKDDLGAWLQAEGWDGLLKQKEKDVLVRAAKGTGQFLKAGADTLIKVAVGVIVGTGYIP